MINRKIFFDGIRQSPFPKKLNQGQVEGCNIILDEWGRRKLIDERWLAYMLATVKWETASTMQPIKEGGGINYLRSKPYWPSYGRGYVQLTWASNYKRMQELLGKHFPKMDLVNRPDDALIPEYAVAIMFEGMLKAESFRGDFTGKSLEDYFNDKTSDWINARRIINILDHALDIAGIAKAFYADIIAAS